MNFCIFRRIAPLFSLLFALSGQRLIAQVDRAATVKSVTIGSPDSPNPSATPISIQVQNISNKTIYAVSFEGSAAWADGSAQNLKFGPYDLLALYVDADLAPAVPVLPTVEKSPLLRPGETFNFSAGVLKNGPPPTSVNVSISMLAFSDRTVMGEPAAINKLLKLRTNLLNRYSATLSDLELIFQADDPVKAAIARAKQIRIAQPGEIHLADDGGRRVSPNEDEAIWLLSIVNGIGAQDKKPGLAMSIKSHQTLIEITKQQSTLQEVTK